MKVLEDQKPRRDGLIEAKGVWGEVAVGALLSTSKRTEVWEVIDTRLPEQIDYGKTHWIKIRERSTGVEHVIAPKMVNAPAYFLLSSTDQNLPAPTPPSNLEEMALLVEHLGAQLLATRDNATGEIHCPDYNAPNGERTGVAPLLEHMRVCHGMDVGALQAAEAQARADGDFDEVRARIHRAHDEAHSLKHPHVGKGGFSHRHVPEDHTII